MPSAKPLYQAARAADLPRIRQLLADGADPNATWHHYTPLHTLAAPDAHHAFDPSPQALACIEALLDGGADPHIKGGFPPTSVMMLAAFAGAAAVIGLLRAHKVKEDPYLPAAEGKPRRYSPTAPDPYGLLALHYVAGSRLPSPGKVKVAARLLDAGADANAETLAGTHKITPIYLAGNAHNLDIFALLLRHGADPHRALTVAAWSAKPFEPYAQLAMDHGAVPDLATADNEPLLNHLVHWGRLTPARWLLARGANPNIPDRNGLTAIDRAKSRGVRL